MLILKSIIEKFKLNELIAIVFFYMFHNDFFAS